MVVVCPDVSKGIMGGTAMKHALDIAWSAIRLPEYVLTCPQYVMTVNVIIILQIVFVLQENMGFSVKIIVVPDVQIFHLMVIFVRNIVVLALKLVLVVFMASNVRKSVDNVDLRKMFWLPVTPPTDIVVVIV